MSDTVPPVGCVFRPDGLFITVIEDGKTYMRVVPWTELYQMGKQGEQKTAEGIMKQVADSMDKAVKSNEVFAKESRERLEEFKRMRTATSMPKPAP